MHRKLIAEIIGSFFLLATVVGSGIMAERLMPSTGGALLANAIATGAILYVLIIILGPISGAHFNPAVTLAMVINREIRAKTAMLYGFSQIAGGILGTLAAHLMFSEPTIQLSTTLRAGNALLFSEGLACFGLVFVILMAVQYNRQAVAMCVGLYITAAYWFTASTSFANPAVTIARSLTDSFSGIYPAHVPAFVAAQLCGAIIAVYTARFLTRVESESH